MTLNGDNVSDYYLRIEGVNLSNFIEDTYDLSTIRGGALTLLKSIEKIERLLGELNAADVKKITSSASIGLFRFRAEDRSISTIKEAVNQCLMPGDDTLPSRHVTFVVDITKFDTDFKRTQTKVTVLNRFNQFKQLTIIIPEKNACRIGSYCDLDYIRPGRTEVFKGDEKFICSDSVVARRDFGKNQKKSFYYDLMNRFGLEVELLYDFVDTFEELSTGYKDQVLDRKMCVIYLDGNHFGQIRKTCDSDTQLTDFSQDIERKRASFLAEVFNRFNHDPRFISTENTYRIEILRWGGDEVTLVVPACLGWEVLSLFYDFSAEWTSIVGRAGLRHAGGMVFCHHKAPIHRVVRLAETLASNAKAADRARNIFQYEVLESFDHIGNDILAYRKTRIPFDLPKPEKETGPWIKLFSLSGQDMQSIQKFFHQIREQLPKNKIYQVLYQPGSPDTAEHDKALESVTKRIKKLYGPEVFRLLESLSAYFHGHIPLTFYHLYALWDYLPEAKRNEA
ncbi:MAG: hypothetical protein KKB20_22895 [Proteobacteria bacterium]|nr:hypothetical protein [Pseudomonadota bacterium]